MSKIAVLIFNDGRNDYLIRTLDSLFLKIKFPSKPYILLLDDGPKNRDLEFLEQTKKKYKINKLILNEVNLGIHKSVQRGWYNLPTDIEYIWHCENDFEYLEEMDLKPFITLLKNPKIFQVSLLRQAWYPEEIKVGGIIQQWPYAFVDADIACIKVVIHREYFTHNPCLYHRRVINPSLQNYNEHTYKTELLKKEPQGFFAIWGNTEDAPRVHHIGERKISR